MDDRRILEVLLPVVIGRLAELEEDHDGWVDHVRSDGRARPTESDRLLVGEIDLKSKGMAELRGRLEAIAGGLGISTGVDCRKRAERVLKSLLAEIKLKQDRGRLRQEQERLEAEEKRLAEERHRLDEGTFELT